jgi:uncharacterized protein with NRDE domain
MCLVALAIDQSRRFPLVIAGNRDEFFKRPATRLGWWSPGAGLPDILSGRDLEAGGTWMGLTAAGRLALLTNVRDPGSLDPGAPSRGEIVTRWLSGDMRSDRFWMRTALAGYNGFNLIAADFQAGECFWASNRGHHHPLRLERGLYGLSNASLDTDWPKVAALKARMGDAMAECDSVDALAARLFDALADREQAPDEELPSTGVSLDWERVLSPAFIRSPDNGYGTRCSTLVIAERVNKRLVTHVLERTFSPVGGMALLRRVALKNWPPRYSENEPALATEQEAVMESEVPAETAAPEASAMAARKTRVRSLLKPAVPKRRRAAAAAPAADGG